MAGNRRVHKTVLLFRLAALAEYEVIAAWSPRRTGCKARVRPPIAYAPESEFPVDFTAWCCMCQVTGSPWIHTKPRNETYILVPCPSSSVLRSYPQRFPWDRQLMSRPALASAASSLPSCHATVTGLQARRARNSSLAVHVPGHADDGAGRTTWDIRLQRFPSTTGSSTGKWASGYETMC